MRYRDYFLALQPRRIVWFVLPPLALIPTAAHWLLSDVPPSAEAFKITVMAAIYLGILLVVLFFSGYVTWDKEREKNQGKWPHLSSQQINKLTERLRSAPVPTGPVIGGHAIPRMRLLMIHRNQSPDCDDLAAQIHDAAVAAGWASMFMYSDRPWPPGITIAVLLGNENETAKILEDALKSVGVSATISTSNDIQPRILIGSKPRLSSS